MCFPGALLFFIFRLSSPLLRYFQRKPRCFVCAGEGGGEDKKKHFFTILVNLIIGDL